MSLLICSIVNEITSTVIGGLILSILYFYFEEYFKPIKNITGTWDVKTKIKESNLERYIGLNLEYKFHILQKGNEIYGSGEKIGEKLKNGSFIKYCAENKTTLTIEGYYKRSIFKKHKIYLYFIEYGKIRESRTSCILEFNHLKKNNIKGDFSSTAADSIGKITLNKRH